jgi:hypothetical protein
MDPPIKVVVEARAIGKAERLNQQIEGRGRGLDQDGLAAEARDRDPLITDAGGESGVVEVQVEVEAADVEVAVVRILQAENDEEGRRKIRAGRGGRSVGTPSWRSWHAPSFAANGTDPQGGA